MGKPFEVTDEWLRRVKAQVDGTEYGSIVITVHDGKIIQIERSERKRYDTPQTSHSSQSRRR
ncbi:YezD family protein [Paenibacillus sp. YIM B09110]|uniref:YezD family protein n=1 Tax=unclassified Paenibacillus TaxID=185978 RepID=UPI00301DD95F